MPLLLQLAVTFVYGTGALLAARTAYGRARTRIIGHCARESATSDPIDRFNDQFLTETTVVALVVGLLWPFALLVFAVVKGAVTAVTACPPATPSDAERDNERLHRHIRDLEEALGMPSDQKHVEPSLPTER